LHLEVGLTSLVADQVPVVKLTLNSKFFATITRSKSPWHSSNHSSYSYRDKKAPLFLFRAVLSLDHHLSHFHEFCFSPSILHEMARSKRFKELKQKQQVQKFPNKVRQTMSSSNRQIRKGLDFKEAPLRAGWPTLTLYQFRPTSTGTFLKNLATSYSPT
jgi:hypothetical protein